MSVEVAAAVGLQSRELMEVARRADAGDDVLALGGGQEVAGRRRAPVTSSRLNATPEQEVSPRLP